MKQWHVRLAFMASDEEYWITDETVEADEMGTALNRAVCQGRRAVVPKGKRIRQLRARVERADAEEWNENPEPKTPAGGRTDP